MEQKATDELFALKRHGLVTVSVAVVLITERDLLVTDVDNPRVVDGDTVAIASQVVDHRLGVVEATPNLWATMKALYQYIVVLVLDWL